METKKDVLNYIESEIAQGKALYGDELIGIPDILLNYFHHITKLAFLKQYHHINEISITQDKLTRLDDGNKVSQTPSLLTKREAQICFENLALKEGIEWNYSSPFASFYTQIESSKYRVSLIHFSTTDQDSSKFFLRKISNHPFDLKSFSQKYESTLKEFILTKKNILIAGSTGSGKTSLLTSMTRLFSPLEHIVTVEDTHEIMLSNQFHTQFIAKNTPGKTMSDYLSYGLRITPDRIILGEIRSKEVIPYLLALNTGHKGCLSTIHANSAQDALHRVALLYSIYSGTNLSYELVLSLICSNIEYVIFMEDKEVKEIIRVYGSEKGQVFIDLALPA